MSLLLAIDVLLAPALLPGLPPQLHGDHPVPGGRVEGNVGLLHSRIRKNIRGEGSSSSNTRTSHQQ